MLSLGQAILRGDREALALVVVIVVGLVLLRRGTGVEAPLGGTREATFTAAPGSYRFYCRVPPTPPPACKAP